MKIKLSRFQNIGLSKKVYFFFVLLIALFMIIVYFLVFKNYTDHVYNSFLTHSIDVDTNLVREISITKTTAENTSDQILSNNILQQFFGGNEEEYDRELQNLLTNQLNFITSYNNITNVVIGDTEGTSYASSQAINATGALGRLKNALPAKYNSSLTRQHMWLPLNENIFGTRSATESYLYLARDIYYLNKPSRLIGFSIIQYDQYLFDQIFSQAAQQLGEYRVLINQDGQVLSSSTEEFKISGTLSGKFDAIVPTDREYVWESPDKQDIVLQYSMAGTEWTMYHSIPRAFVFRELGTVYQQIAFTAILQLGITLVIATLMGRSVTRPIGQLVRVMDNYGNGNLMVRSEENRMDEVGHLQSRFNVMADKIEQLLEDSREKEKEKQRMELNVLQYQINPHFLYNTLDSINWMAQKEGDHKISLIVTYLARFFRLSLSKTGINYTINDELSHAAYYLEINKLRYADQIDYMIIADADVRREKTLRIILQPIIENSFKHGFPDNHNKKFITIEVEKAGGIIVFRIKDNGVGMPADKATELNSMLRENVVPMEKEFHIGLLNVNRRIKLQYGEEFGLMVESTKHSGTCIIINIPTADQPN